MSDSMEENTRWVSTWIVNDSEFYDYARMHALAAREHGDPSILRRCIEGVLRSAKSGESAWYVNRAMSDVDFDNTDWAEISEDLLGE